MRADKHLTENNEATFFNKLEEGDVFTYSEAFDAKEVIQKAKLRGKDIEYCAPETAEYRKYGCYTCKVLPEMSSWKKELLNVADCPQRQDSLVEQLRDLHVIANKFGFYDAADYLRNVVEVNGK